MLTFSIIAEGLTDQIIIENILLGYFEEQDEEPLITYIQPPRPPSETPGGWTNVFNSLKRKDYEGALQYNDYLIIHIDCDVQEQQGFDVPRRVNGSELTVSQRAEAVINRLRQEIDDDFLGEHSDRILFAIAVDTIECWLLPLLYTNNKVAKLTGCLATANAALRKLDRDGLSAGDKKFPDAYQKASKEYCQRRRLMDCHNKNPSLELFINQLNSL